MNPLQAWLRVDEKGRNQWIFVDADSVLSTVAQLLCMRAANAARKQLQNPAVYRLEISEDLNNPQIDVTQIASNTQHFVLAQIRREAEEELSINTLRFSAASQGTEAGRIFASEQLTRLASEAAASRAGSMIPQKTETLEIAIDT